MLENINQYKEKVLLFVNKTNNLLEPTGFTVEIILSTTLIVFSLFIFKKFFNKFLFKRFVKYIDHLLDDNLQEDTLKGIIKLKKPANIVIDITIFKIIATSFLSFIPYIALFCGILYFGIFAWTIILIIDLSFSIYLYHKEESVKRSEIVFFSRKVFKFIAVILLMLMFLHLSGINITAIITSLGIIGMAIALAARDTLANIFASLSILLDNPFSQKDRIKTKNVEGTVVEIGIRSTTIRAQDNSLITVPNAELANSFIQNLDRRLIGRMIKLNIAVPYSTNKDSLKKALKDIKRMIIKHKEIAYNEDKSNKGLIAIEDKFGIKDDVMVNLIEPTSNALNIQVIAFTKTIEIEEWLDIQEDIIFKIWDILNKHNIEFTETVQPVVPLKKKKEDEQIPLQSAISIPKEHI